MSGPLVLAHRGARLVAPENTVEAFVLALTLGADGVELDVHRSVDGALVVHHDAHAHGLGVLAEQTFDAIRAGRPEIPTLDEALDACDGTLVNVEIKNLPGDADFDHAETTAELVVATLGRRQWRDRVLVSSFHLPTVDRVRELDASVPTAFLTGMAVDPLQVLDVCVDHGHGAYHPFVVMLQGAAATTTAARAHDLGIAVNVWTVNDAAEMKRLADAGVDGIVTDVPDVARSVLDGR